MRKFRLLPRQAFFIPLLALVVLGMSACSTQERAAALAGIALMSEVRSADFTLESGDVFAAVNSIDISISDQDRVLAAFQTYQASRDNLGRLAEDLTDLPGLISALEIERNKLKLTYSQLQSVVAGNWDKYSPEVQAALSRWRREAYALDSSYQAVREILTSPPDPLTKADVVQSLLNIVQNMALRG